MKRPAITPESVQAALAEVKAALDLEISRKGNHTLTSSHEILGIINEEHSELVDAVRSNNLEEVRSELEDIAVAAVFSLACIEQKTLDW